MECKLGMQAPETIYPLSTIQVGSELSITGSEHQGGLDGAMRPQRLWYWSSLLRITFSDSILKWDLSFQPQS